MWTQSCRQNNGTRARQPTERPVSASHNCSLRCGFTLVEVIAGMILLAALATGAMMSTTIHSRQIHQARQRTEAARVADAMLESWSQNEFRDITPTDYSPSGPVPGHADWVWRSRLIHQEASDQFRRLTVRFEIFARPTAGSDTVDSLVSVDVLVVVKS